MFYLSPQIQNSAGDFLVLIRLRFWRPGRFCQVSSYFSESPTDGV